MAFDRNYFRPPSLIPAIIIIILMMLMFLSMTAPESTLLDYFGPLGRLGRYLSYNYYGLLQIILVAALAAHIGEAIYARNLCLKNGLTTSAANKWMIQTFFIGFPSLLVLVPYLRDKKDA